MSCCGSKFKKVWMLNEDGFLEKKLDKDGKQEQVNLFQDIQDHFGEVDFKSRVENNKINQSELMRSLNSSVNKSSEVYEDITTNYDFVDIMNSLAKLKSKFTVNGKEDKVAWYSVLDNYIAGLKEKYKSEKNVVKSEKNVVKKQEVKKDSEGVK